MKHGINKGSDAKKEETRGDAENGPMRRAESKSQETGRGRRRIKKRLDEKPNSRGTE